MPQPRSNGLARRIAANTLHAASGRVVGIGLWLVLTPSMLHSLGADGFGIWSLFFALTGYLGALDLGFAQATLRYVSAASAREDASSGGEVGTLSLLGYAFLGVAWTLVIPAIREPVLDFLRVSSAVRPGAEFAMTAGAVVFTLAGFANTCVSVLQGHGRFDLANGVLLTVSTVQAAGLVLAMRLHWGLEGMVSATAAGWLCATLMGLASIGRAVPAFRWGSPARAVRHGRELARFGGPMQLANVLGVIHQQLDKVLLARFVAIAVVAPYELGLRVSTAASTFSQLMLLAMIPAASAMHARLEHEALRHLHRRANRYVLTLSAVLTAALVGSAGPMFSAWLGMPPPGAALALRGLAVAGYLAIAGGVGGAIARGAGRTDLEAEFSAVALGVHVALGLWWVPRWHLAGAVAAIVCGNLAGMTWFLSRLAGVLSWRRLPVVLEPLGWPLVIIVVGGAAGWGCTHFVPAAAMGSRWLYFVFVAAASSCAAATVALGTGFLSLRELRSLLAPGRGLES